LKPFDRERFQKALGRAVDRVKHRESASQADAQAAVLTELKPAAKPLERLAVKTGGRVIFVKVADIDYIEAAHNYVELHVEKQSHLLRETLNSIEARLPADRFVRISRSVIVNIERVKELQPLFYGEYTVTLHNGVRLTLSRRYRDKLKLLGVD
jgi:two-component system LytT family response regulator